MNDTPHFDLGKFVPGFDFLQSLAQGASSSMAQLPKLSSWVAPTVSVEELDKRIQELKTVQFWLEQNSRALAATMQALEVQKMTLVTLKGMNFSIGDVANAFKPKAADTPDNAAVAGAPAARPGEPTNQPDAPEPALALVDPMQWWGALTSQFQQIAANALKDAAKTGLPPTMPDGPSPTASAGATTRIDTARKPAAAGKTRKATTKPASTRPASRKTPASSTAARRRAG